jgi:ABC-type sulfate/molybdate transport systems ATPase subunit
MPGVIEMVALWASPSRNGRVVGLVGPNGAGKTTLLHMAVGLLTPTAGTISVLGMPPASGPGQLARIGFVAQDTPVFRRLSVADYLRLGGWQAPPHPAGPRQHGARHRHPYKRGKPERPADGERAREHPRRLDLLQ